MSEATLFPLPALPKPMPTGIRRAAALSECGQYRWNLVRVWRAGPLVMWIGCNPSTADATKDDPTVLRWIRFTDAWGYGGFVALNLYPFRTPNVAAVKRWADWQNNGPDYYARDRLHANLDVLRNAARDAAMIVACWGAIAWDDEWIDHVVEEIQSEAPDKPIYCLGKVAGGDPIHPMARGRNRVPDDAKPIIWRAA